MCAASVEKRRGGGFAKLLTEITEDLAINTVYLLQASLRITIPCK